MAASNLLSAAFNTDRSSSFSPALKGQDEPSLVHVYSVKEALILPWLCAASIATSYLLRAAFNIDCSSLFTRQRSDLVSAVRGISSLFSRYTAAVD